MFRIAVYNILGTGTPVTMFLEGEFVLHGFAFATSQARKMTFSVSIGSTKATATNLQKYRKVQLYRLRRDTSGIFDPVWYGFIQATKQNGEEIDVECMGALELFKKRLTSANQSLSGQGSTLAFSLLSTANGDSDTGIIQGTGGVTATANLVEDKVDLHRAFEDIALATTAEFEVDATRALNYVPLLGSDKSATITLIYRRDGTPGSNCLAIEPGEDGQPLYNRIIGTTTALSGLTSTKNDPTSQSTYGVLATVKQFNKAQDQATLDLMTQGYLDQVKNPPQDFKVQPIGAVKSYNPVTNAYAITGLQFGDVRVGDLVQAVIITENQNINLAKRIVELDVAVDENLNEQLTFTLTKSGIYLSAGVIGFDETQELKRRLREAEARLT